MNFNYYCNLCKIFAVAFLLNACQKDEPSAPKEFQFPSKVIHKIVVQPDGVKWFATEKGLVSYNGDKWTSYSDDQHLTNGSILDFVFENLSGAKKLWLGTETGLTALDFAVSPVTLSNFRASSSGLLDDKVTALGIDAQSVKYIGTSKGLSILKNTHWENYYGSGAERILANYKISSVAAAQNGYIYAATEGGGVSRFKYTDAISGATTYNKPWAWGLPSDTVYVVITDGNKQWYGTNRGVGFHESENTKNDWTTYTREEGLVCDTVYAIATDPSGSIWFGTHKGISKLSVNQWVSYSEKDGLVANKINAIAVDTDGSLWFGTDKGISHFKNNQWINY